jgi:hypothetical protein
MKRWHQEVAHCKREQATDKLYDGRRERQLGHYRKRHALDCGKPHCQVCHQDKFPKRELTYQEVRSDFEYRGQMKELKEKHDRVAQPTFRGRDSEAQGTT